MLLPQINKRCDIRESINAIDALTYSSSFQCTATASLEHFGHFLMNFQLPFAGRLTVREDLETFNALPTTLALTSDTVGYYPMGS